MPKTLSSSPKTTHRNTRNRFMPAPKGGLCLKPRDEELLTDLYLHGVMSRNQIEELYFTSTPRCNFRLRQLYDFGYVHRHYLPAVPAALPYGTQAIYSIGKAAVPLIAARLGVDTAQVMERYRRSKTPSFLAHTLEVVNLYLSFRRATRETGIVLDLWLPELLCRHPFDIRLNGGSWRPVVFKPDAFVRLLRAGVGSYASFFVEVDLGHTSSKQFLGKLQTHQYYLESGLFTETFSGETFHTLVVTTSQGRLRNLRSLVESRGSDLFWFTTFESVQSSGVLAPIWTTPLSPDPTSLI